MLPLAAPALMALALGGTGTLEAQELPLKRAVPESGAFECPSFPTPVQPRPEDRAAARRLASMAAQELILGNRGLARDFLDRAILLDPASAGHSYQHARVLEELGEAATAVDRYCRALSLGLADGDAADARARVQALTRDDGQGLPDAAVGAFRSGIARFDAGRPSEAAAAFERAAAAAPEWPSAHYNLGEVLAGLGRREAARAALRRYLALAPEADDVLAVSERIGELQVPTATTLPRPGVALVAGLVPGMGQVYTGRPAEGMGFLGLAGGAAAAGLLHDRGVQPDFRPVGLAIAGTATAISALDGFLHARRQRAGPASPRRPNAAAAMALGVVPGLGQVYAGRSDVGLAFLSLVAGTVAASDLLETRAVRRFAPDGLVVAGALTGIGALEAFVTADLHQGAAPAAPGPWTALGLGLVPGMGQFYEGRTAMGLTVVSLAAGFTTAGLVYRIGRGVTFRDQGLAAGAGVVGLGALEAFIWALRHQDDGVAGADRGGGSQGAEVGTGGLPGALRVGPLTVEGPALTAVGGRPGVRWLGFRFR